MTDGGTQLRIGGVRIGLNAGQSILDAADLLAGVARVNLRALRDDPKLRADAVGRVLSPPCATRCYVSEDGARNDCNCLSGFQYASDPEQQAMQGCPARDVWNDLRSLLIGHAESGRGRGDPIVADCDCLTPASLAVQAYTAWYAPKGYGMGGLDLGALHDDERRFAVGITLPPPEPGKARIGHAYSLLNRPPNPPQPPIRIDLEGSPWWVWDGSAHWGMQRPPDSFYTTGEYVAVEVSRKDLDGLRRK